MSSESLAAAGKPRQKPMVIATIPKAFLQYLESQGLSLLTIYREELIERIQSAGAHEEISEREFVSMFEPAQKALDRPSVVMDALFETGPALMGVFASSVTSSPDLKDGIKQLVRYNHVTGTLGQLNVDGFLDQGAVRIWWDAQSKDALTPGVMEFRLALMTIGIRVVCQAQEMTVDLALPYPSPPHAKAYERYFGGEVTFGSDVCQMTAPGKNSGAREVKIANQPVRIVPDDEFDAASLPQHPEQFHNLLTKFMRDNMPSGRITLEDAAKALDISGRTLQRWLDKTGIHYQELLDQIRLVEAKRLLIDPQVGLPRIAYLLGYASQSNFQNAFRRWMGMSPGDFRKRAQGLPTKKERSRRSSDPKGSK